MQYDFGRTVQDREFKITGYLASPTRPLLNALTTVRGRAAITGDTLRELVHATEEKTQGHRRLFHEPDPESDLLFRSDFIHKAEHKSCMQVCRQYTHMLAERAENVDRYGTEPFVHYGTIASGNQLMRDARMRDKLATNWNVLCFEMEASGLMSSYSCLVIRGISDYADTHKNDAWKYYAAINAAAYAKLLLQHVTGLQEEPRHPIAQGGVDPDRHFLRNSRSRSDEDRLPSAFREATLDESRRLRPSALTASRSISEYGDDDQVNQGSSRRTSKQGRDGRDRARDHRSPTEGAMVRYEHDMSVRFVRADRMVRCQTYYMITNNEARLRQWLGRGDRIVLGISGDGGVVSTQVIDLLWLLVLRYFQSSLQSHCRLVRLDVVMMEPQRNDEEAERVAWLFLVRQLETSLNEHHPGSWLLGRSGVRDDDGILTLLERFQKLVADALSTMTVVCIINVDRRDDYSPTNGVKNLVERLFSFGQLAFLQPDSRHIQLLYRFKLLVTAHTPVRWIQSSCDANIGYQEATFGPSWDFTIDELDATLREVLSN